ncbi:hypothetical protein FIBSPDRAFT_475302 [Athelia psychrophila]|uniref:Uncharacterized protein n=1 Tax=Athelia psychrophila TaxID=1759441 RepID=A0A166L6J1_9AGAM|nr:hypothetical protein FIBSPDRAFT_475302 [Fibularhizoctonia sp. CBS 109695]
MQLEPDLRPSSAPHMAQESMHLDPMLMDQGSQPMFDGQQQQQLHRPGPMMEGYHQGHQQPFSHSQPEPSFGQPSFPSPAFSPYAPQAQRVSIFERGVPVAARARARAMITSLKMWIRSCQPADSIFLTGTACTHHTTILTLNSLSRSLALKFIRCPPLLASVLVLHISPPIIYHLRTMLF